MDRDAKDVAMFITWIVGLGMFVTFSIAACENTFDSPNARFSRRNNEALLMKTCVEAKMEWVSGDCKARRD